MGQLCLYLPPFASDYAGVCSALFDLDCLTVINDASCCTSHYVYYDEPRWDRQVRSVFCTALRNVDAVLGHDDKIIENICEAAASIDTELIAVLGTPVPAIVGMDAQGIASEIEHRIQRACFGFNTTGFSYYDRGIAEAGNALIDRFAEPVPVVRGRLNIVGLTPLDIGANGNDEDLVALLEKAGWQVGCRFFMGMTLADLRTCASAELNLAVSAAGLKVAKHLKRKFGTPYLGGLPLGTSHAAHWLRTFPTCGRQERSKARRNKRLLIVADQIMGNALRDALRLYANIDCQIDVASFFSWDAQLAEPDDLQLKDEAQYLRLLKNVNYFALAGDPMLIRSVPASAELKFELVHPAVSSKLCWKHMPRFLSDDFEQQLIQLRQALM